jgi:magnesium-dependent phosphatase-1
MPVISYPSTPITADELWLLPSMVVLDLDFTVWPFDCGAYMQSPFTLTDWGIVDRHYSMAEPYTDLRSIMSFLVDNDVPVSICSRNPDITSIESLMRCIKFNCKRGLISMWDAIPEAQIHAYSSDRTGGKNKHFTLLQLCTGVDLTKVLFFDDLEENIRYARQRGITCVHVSTTTGLNWSMLRLGLQRYATAGHVHSVEPLITPDVPVVEATGLVQREGDEAQEILKVVKYVVESALSL